MPRGQRYMAKVRYSTRRPRCTPASRRGSLGGRLLELLYAGCLGVWPTVIDPSYSNFTDATDSRQKSRACQMYNGSYYVKGAIV